MLHFQKLDYKFIYENSHATKNKIQSSSFFPLACSSEFKDQLMATEKSESFYSESWASEQTYY